jgi:hypothetical protein
VARAYEAHVKRLEEAHRSRELDWHQLSNKWKEFEMNAIEENHKWVEAGVCGGGRGRMEEE